MANAFTFSIEDRLQDQGKLGEVFQTPDYYYIIRATPMLDIGSHC